MKKDTMYTRLLKLFITFAIMGWVIYSYGWDDISRTIIHANYGWVIFGVILFVISVILGAWQWHLILENKRIDIPFGATLRIYFIGMFFNNFILGTIAGDAFKVAALHLDKKNGKASFAATFIDRLAGFLILSLFAIVGGVIIFIVNIQQNKQFYMIMGVLAFFVAIFFGFFIVLLSRTLQDKLRVILQKLPGFPFKEIVQNTLEETFINRRGRDDKMMLLWVGIISLFIQTLRIIVNILAAQALGMFTFSTLQYYFVIIPIVSLLVIVPMPFGVREAMGGMIFGLAGFSIEQSMIMLFLATIMCVLGSLVGGIMFLTDKKKREDGAVVNSDPSTGE